MEQEQEYQLTRTVSGIMAPRLSPDGQQVVLSTYYHGRRELYLMDMPSWPEIRRKDGELAARASEATRQEAIAVEVDRAEHRQPLFVSRP